MQDIDILVAKAGENKWLPLSQHLEDTAAMMRYLCEKYVSLSVIAATGLDPDEFTAICVFCAAVHDIGKATPAFQGKILPFVGKHQDILDEYGFSIAKQDDKTKKSPHALAGAAILNQFFKVNESICDVIAAHHGKPRLTGRETKFSYQIKKYESNFYTESDIEKYKEVWEKILEKALEYAEICNKYGS